MKLIDIIVTQRKEEKRKEKKRKKKEKKEKRKQSDLVPNGDEKQTKDTFKKGPKFVIAYSHFLVLSIKSIIWLKFR